MRFELGQKLIDAVRTKVTLEMLPVLKRDFVKPIHTYDRYVLQVFLIQAQGH